MDSMKTRQWLHSPSISTVKTLRILKSYLKRKRKKKNNKWQINNWKNFRVMMPLPHLQVWPSQLMLKRKLKTSREVQTQRRMTNLNNKNKYKKNNPKKQHLNQRNKLRKRLLKNQVWCKRPLTCCNQERQLKKSDPSNSQKRSKCQNQNNQSQRLSHIKMHHQLRKI